MSPLVAILDSGLHRAHPHVAGLRSSGFALYHDGDGFREDPDYADCTGHGTAVTAALHRLLPEADVLCLRILDEELRCSSRVLAQAIVRAAEAGVRVINLSLGSGDPDSAELLSGAVARAAELGAFCVAAAHPNGRPLWPADLPSVVSAQSHRNCPLDDLFRIPGPVPRYLAHGFPRPIEGQPPTRNFFGPSFAAIHVSARIVEALTEEPTLSFEGLVARLDARCSGDWTEEPGPG